MRHVQDLRAVSEAIQSADRCPAYFHEDPAGQCEGPEGCPECLESMAEAALRAVAEQERRTVFARQDRERR